MNQEDLANIRRQGIDIYNSQTFNNNQQEFLEIGIYMDHL